MTIKSIKEEWSKKDKIKGCSGKTQFAVYPFTEKGTCVVIVKNDGGDWGREAVACVSTITGEDLLHDHCRPCDNMDDALDVVGEMLNDMFNNDEFSENELKLFEKNT